MNHRTKALKYLDMLDGIVDAAARNPAARVDVTDLFGWFSFDIMSDWTLSKTFDMLKNERWHHIVVGMRRARSMLGPFSPAPWMFQIGMHLMPRVGLIKGWYDMMAWCAAQMTNRLEGGKDTSPEVPDLAYYLHERSVLKDQDSRRRWLEGDSLVAIVAGRYVLCSSGTGSLPPSLSY